MAVLVFLTDRTPEDALPALADLRLDVKHEPLSVTALDSCRGDRARGGAGGRGREPGAGLGCPERAANRSASPALVVVERDRLERFPWHEAADEFVYPGAPRGGAPGAPGARSPPGGRR